MDRADYTRTFFIGVVDDPTNSRIKPPETKGFNTTALGLVGKELLRVMAMLCRLSALWPAVALEALEYPTVD